MNHRKPTPASSSTSSTASTGTSGREGRVPRRRRRRRRRPRRAPRRRRAAASPSAGAPSRRCARRRPGRRSHRCPGPGSSSADDVVGHGVLLLRACPRVAGHQRDSPCRVESCSGSAASRAQPAGAARTGWRAAGLLEHCRPARSRPGRRRSGTPLCGPLGATAPAAPDVLRAADVGPGLVTPSPGFGSTPLITPQRDPVGVGGRRPRRDSGVLPVEGTRVVQACGSSDVEHEPEVRPHGAAVVADDAEAAGDDVGIGDQHLLDAVQPRDGDLVEDVEVAHQRAQARAGVLHQLLERGRRRSGALTTSCAQVGVALDQGVGDQPEVGRPLLDRRAVGDLRVEDGLAVGDQLQRLRQRLLGAGQQQVAVVDQPAEVVAGAVEGLARAR